LRNRPKDENPNPKHRPQAETPNPKHQVPKKLQTSNPKRGPTRASEHWTLEFDYSLGFGDWTLGFTGGNQCVTGKALARTG
jgi:hypothetical protein